MRLLTLACTSSLAAAISASAALSASPTPSQAAVTAPAKATLAATPGPKWPQELSDVAPDPAIRHGRLPNGMRYALRRNTTPPGEAVVRLRIGAGSLNEREDQLGLAHFIEHMVFNGTKNVPEGEFVKRTERLGLSFGADTNASTNFDETIYSLNLPNTSAKVVDTALLLMRETADKALMATDAINRERGVVLSEERSRGGVGLRSTQASLAFLMPGQLPPKRMPIGSVGVISNAPRERFVEFYEAYYRPENATLVMVGDFDVDEMERKIREHFSDWQGEGPAGPKPNLGPVAKRDSEVKIFAEPGIPSTIAMSWVSGPDLAPDSRAKRRDEFRKQLALAVLNRRLVRVALSDDPPFLNASASEGTAFKAIYQAGLGVQFRPGAWRPALEAAEQEVRRAVQYGLTQPELDREIAVMRETYKTAATQAKTRWSTELAGNILREVSEDKVVTTPADRLASMENAVRGFTAAQASAVLREMFRGGGPLVFLTSPEPIEGGEVAVAQALRESQQVAVVAPQPLVAKTWPYTNFGAPGRVVERRYLADLGTTFVRFANGVRLTVKPTRLEANSIQIAVRAGEGNRDLPPGRFNPSWAARSALIEGGLGKISADEIEDALPTTNVSADITLDDDDFTILGSTRPVDLPVQMELLTAYLTDPGWRQQGFHRTQRSQPDLFEQYRSSPSGVLSLNLPRLLRSGDSRFGTPPLDVELSTDIGDVRTVLSPLRTDPIEVLMVGDVTVDEAIRQTAHTFGALPPRRASSPPPSALRTPFPAGGRPPVRLTHNGRADQGAAFIAWPTTDQLSDPQKSRTLDMLTQILRLRLLDELREKQGVTYSPNAQITQSKTYPGYGFIAAIIEAPPARLGPFFTDAAAIAKTLRNTPVDPDEIGRALAPRLTTLQRERDSNSFWVTALSGAQADPRRLAVIRETIAGYKRITPADVQRVAREYLRDDRAYRVIAVPASEGKAGGEGTD